MPRNPYLNMPRRGGMRGFGDARLNSGGNSSSLPAMPVPGMSNVPPVGGGSIVQGDGFYYSYNIIFAASIAPAAVSTVTLQFDQVTVFKWVRSTAFADISGAQVTSATVIPVCTLKITDTGSGMSFMNQPVPFADLAGDAQLPYVLPTPQFILANATLQFTATNNSGATTYLNLQFVMQGYKLYNYQNQNPGQ